MTLRVLREIVGIPIALVNEVPERHRTVEWLVPRGLVEPRSPQGMQRPCICLLLLSTRSSRRHCASADLAPLPWLAGYPATDWYLQESEQLPYVPSVHTPDLPLIAIDPNLKLKVPGSNLAAALGEKAGTTDLARRLQLQALAPFKSQLMLCRLRPAGDQDDPLKPREERRRLAIRVTSFDVAFPECVLEQPPSRPSSSSSSFYPTRRSASPDEEELTLRVTRTAHRRRGVVRRWTREIRVGSRIVTEVVEEVYEEEWETSETMGPTSFGRA